MSDNQINSKRIAKNTIMLYVRMLLSIVVSLYTSRVVLQTLGVEDYGIYGVVGGVVAMFSFLNAAMSGATSRFLTFEMGKARNNDNDELIHSQTNNQELTTLQKTFSSAMIIHVCIALIVFFLAITIGLWFLNNKLVIPEGRMTAAYWVYVCSILGMFVSVTQVPYNATIIAHEKMGVYAYFELLNVFLKLGIVYLLQIGNCDKLILYAFLILGVNVIVAIAYRIYCLKHYEEANFHWVIDKPILKSITSFSIYNLLGNFGAVFNLQGINFLINIFFGVALNAAASVAATLSGVVQGFISNVITAFRPPITKAYAQDDIPTVERLLKLALIASIVINSFFIIPLLLELGSVLKLWLGTVPEFADTFCCIILISIYFETIRYILIIGVHAVGKVKNVSLASGILYILNPFAVFACLKLNMGPEVSYIGNVVVNILLIVWVAMLLHRYIPSLHVLRVLSTMIIPSIIAILTFTTSYFVTHTMEPTFTRVVITTVISVTMVALASYLFCLNKSQRTEINNMFLKMLKEILPNPYRGDYYIGFVDKSDIIYYSGSWYDKIKWVNVNKYKKDGWFADPFFYKVTDTQIILFAEQWFYEINRGRLVKMKIRRSDYCLEEVTPILTLETHLSFPIIWRENGKEYVYPENEQSGCLKIYEIDTTTQKLHSPKVLISERLIDSQIAKVGGEYFIFGVVLSTGAWSDTRNLQIYKSDNLFGPYTRIQTIETDKNCERGAGVIISIGSSTILRPAQNCDGAYGRETIMYQMEYDGSKFTEKELYRITPNKRMRNAEVLHTYNECDGLCVLDGHQHYNPILYRLVKRLRPDLQV